MLERYSSAIGNAGGKQIPLGIFYLASYLREHGHEVRVVEGEGERLSIEKIAADALEYKPELIGISSSTVAFHRALEMAREVKAQMPDVQTVLGGTHISATVEDAMRHTEFDFGVLGEGEVTLNALVDTLQNHGDFASVEGLVYRENGSLKVNPPRPLIPDLDSLPFPAHDLITDFSLYNPPTCNYKKIPVANIITSRGCPNACTFCDRSVFGNKLRQRSAANIAEEIEILYRRYGVREIAFGDDTFTFKPKRIFELFEILDRKGIHFPWTCQSRVDTVDFETLKFMRDKGCWHISFGIESGSEEILKKIKKKISLEKAREVIGWCRKLGILTKGFFIIGHPGETPETIEKSIRVALDIPMSDAVIQLNTPFPGTEQYRDAQKFGSIEETDWAKYNTWCPVFVPEGLSQKLLLKKQREFYRRFYIRPRIMWRYFLSFLSLSGLRRFSALILSLPFFLSHKQK